MNYCSNCGKPVKGFNFCPNCGTKVGGANIDFSRFVYPDSLPEGYKWIEGQFGKYHIIKKGSASDRPPGM